MCEVSDRFRSLMDATQLWADGVIDDKDYQDFVEKLYED